MSTIADTIDANNAIDAIIVRVSEIVLEEQSVDFGKLRQITILSSQNDNFATYVEIIVLAIIKHLGLKKAFQVESSSNQDAYRLFNAMNLNDESLCKMFVEIISTVAPEVISTISVIISDLAAKLARENATRYTADRLARAQEVINQKIERGEIKEGAFESRYDAAKEAKEVRRADKAKVEKIKSRKQSFSLALGDYFTGGTVSTKLKNKDSKHKHKKSNSSSEGRSKASSNSRDRELLVGVTKLSFHNDRGSNIETASETTERLVKVRGKDRAEIPDAEEEYVPTAEEIRQTNARRDVNFDEESFDL